MCRYLNTFQLFIDIKQGEERLYEYGVKNLTHGISIFSKFLSFLLSCQHLSNIFFLNLFYKRANDKLNNISGKYFFA